MKQATMPRALVVEDDQSWQQILTELLNDCGLAVDVADSYETALTTMRAVPHRMAVVDLSLSGRNHHNQDGLSVLEALHRADPDCTAVLLTGFATVEIAVSAMNEYGAYSCLRKEMFRRAQFRELVRKVLTIPPADVVEQKEDDGAAVEADRSDVVEAIGERKSRVLVVEDDAGWSGIFSELLTDSGHQVQLCRSYGEALRHLKRGGVDLAVVDLSLASSIAPDDNADGFRLLGACQQTQVPAIVVSGIASPLDAERAYQEFGAYAFLEKQSFDRRTFRQVVSEALAQQASDSHLSHLTEREREVLDLLAQGMTNKQIAERLFISPNTVKRHLKAVFIKLEVNTRSAAAAKAIGG